jgi:hypothetical protein
MREYYSEYNQIWSWNARTFGFESSSELGRMIALFSVLFSCVGKDLTIGQSPFQEVLSNVYTELRINSESEKNTGHNR